jgi:hypothetical protein
MNHAGRMCISMVVSGIEQLFKPFATPLVRGRLILERWEQVAERFIHVH